jgi:parallel beta-helix repeat protein
MHRESYGFDAAEAGDTVEFIDRATLCAKGTAQVVAVKNIDPYIRELTLDREIDGVAADSVIENISWTAEADITGNTFRYIPTRGILYTSRGRCVIANNIFDRTYMSAIHISDDADSWYESGMVRDVTIANNRFIECGAPVISVKPENSVINKNKPVHSGIVIENNELTLKSGPAISVKSATDITVRNNTATGTTAGAPLIVLRAVAAVTFAGNDWRTDNQEIEDAE